MSEVTGRQKDYLVRAVALTAATLGLASFAPHAEAASYIWTNAGSGTTTYSWSTPGNWNLNSSYPGATGTTDTASISNKTPVQWPVAGSDNITFTTAIQVDVTGVNMNSLSITDDGTVDQANARRSIINFQVSQNATIQNINTNYDGAGRSYMTIDTNRTLSVNTITSASQYIDRIRGSGTLKMIADGNNTATWNHIFVGAGQDIDSATFDMTEPLTMKFLRVGATTTQMEFTNAILKIGHASSAQTFTTSEGGVPLRWVMRPNGINQIYRASANDVDMGVRTAASPAGASDGISLERATTGDNGGNTGRNLLTDASGNAVAGTVTAASYRWAQSSNAGQDSTALLAFDKLGSNLTLNGGSFQFLTIHTAPTGLKYNDVNTFWILPGKTLSVLSGNISINDAIATGSTLASGGVAMPGRMGIYFPGATLNARGNLDLLGPTATAGSSNGFLNDGTGVGDVNAPNSAILVGGNVTVRARNASGFTTLGTAAGNMSSGSVTAASPGGIANAIKSDDFDLRSTTLTMNGGGAAKTLEWRTDAPDATQGLLTAGTFGQASFTLDSLVITNNTAVNYVSLSELFLDNNLSVTVGSVLAFGSFGSGLSEIHVFDPTGVKGLQALSDVWANRITGAGIKLTPGVGFTLTNNLAAVPEPTSATVLLTNLTALLIGRRHRRSK